MVGSMAGKLVVMKVEPMADYSVARKVESLVDMKVES